MSIYPENPCSSYRRCAGFAILTCLGLVAQLVEQRTENPCVGGSIPPRATKKVKPSLAITRAFVFSEQPNASYGFWLFRTYRALSVRQVAGLLRWNLELEARQQTPTTFSLRCLSDGYVNRRITIHQIRMIALHQPRGGSTCCFSRRASAK